MDITIFVLFFFLPIFQRSQFQWFCNGFPVSKAPIQNCSSLQEMNLLLSEKEFSMGSNLFPLEVTPTDKNENRRVASPVSVYFHFEIQCNFSFSNFCYKTSAYLIKNVSMIQTVTKF